MAGALTGNRALRVSAAVLSAGAALLPARAAEGLKATPDTPFGWRGDGSGRFPDAEPVTEWSAAKNVLWRTPMPDWSNSQPVVAEEVLFVCSEPTTLLCVRRSDGTILWQKTHDYEDLLAPAEREQVKKDLLTAERLRKIELEPLKQKLQEVNRNLQGLPDDRYLRSTKASLERKKESLEERLGQLEQWRPPKVDPTIGHSNCTPVTDGAGVFALFGNGVGAVYDMEGNRRWARVIRRAKTGCGHSMSPVLAGNVLVMAIDNEVLGVNATTGVDVWAHDAKHPTAGLAAAKVGSVHVVATAEGSILRASDGKLLATVKGAARSPFAAPMIRRDVLYLLGEGDQLLMDLLVPDDAGGLRLSRLGAGRVFQGSYYASCLYANGCVFLWEKGNVLNVLSAKTGQRVHTRRLGLGGAGYSSPTLGGRYIFLGADNGVMAVVRAKVAPSPGGKLSFDLEEVARNQLEPFRSSPVFAGNHMYLRTLRSLCCIGSGNGGADRTKAPGKVGPDTSD